MKAYTLRQNRAAIGKAKISKAKKIAFDPVATFTKDTAQKTGVSKRRKTPPDGSA
jgi:hypothetical protein